jgi:hypothetical protein
MMIKKLLPLLFLFVGFQAHAITIGNLTYNGSTITGDGRTYLGFDTIASYDYYDAVAATSAEEEYSDYRIANTADADYFIGSLFGSSTDECSTTDGILQEHTLCGEIDSWFDGLFGTSYNSTYDIFLYLADENPYANVAILYVNQNGEVSQDESWANFNHSVKQHVIGSNEMSWLLVKDADYDAPDAETASVPSPSTIALFALGLVGLGFARRRRS